MVEKPGDPRLGMQRQVGLAVADGTQRVVIGLVVSAVLAVIKLGTGVAGASYALIADGVESTFDVFSGLLVWGGLRAGGSPPNAEYPYGQGRAEQVAGLAIAAMLLSGAIGIAAGAIRGIVVPHGGPASFTLPVLAVVVVVKEAMYRFLDSGGRTIGSGALRADAWHHRSDALTSMAAFVGISVALVGGEGFETADDWAALLACGVIAWNGTKLFRASIRDVLDAAAPPEIIAEVRRIAEKVPGVTGIDDLRVRRSGLVWFVDIHVEVDGSRSVREGHEIAHHVQDRLVESDFPISDALVHIEPAKVSPEPSETGAGSV